MSLIVMEMRDKFHAIWEEFESENMAIGDWLTW